MSDHLRDAYYHLLAEIDLWKKRFEAADQAARALVKERGKVSRPGVRELRGLELETSRFHGVLDVDDALPPAEFVAGYKTVQRLTKAVNVMSNWHDRAVNRERDLRTAREIVESWDAKKRVPPGPRKARGE